MADHTPGWHDRNHRPWHLTERPLMAKKPTRLQITWSDDETLVIAPFAQAIVDAHRAESPDDTSDDETILQRFCSGAMIDKAGAAQNAVAERELREQDNARRQAAQKRAEAARAVLIPQPEPEPEPAPETA